MRRLLPSFHHCPALCKQVGLVRLRHRFSIHFPCTLHLLSPFVKSFFLPAKIRKRQGLNAEKSKTDILNVKCNPLLTGSLLKREGIFPAYHMNKPRWVSLLLDGPLPDEGIIGLLLISYDLAKGRR